jgi:hypothetical protein
MHLAENLMVYALLVPGRMALSTILCCVAFIFVMFLFGRHYPALSGLMPSYLVIRKQGFFLIFWSPRIHYVICHWLDKR